MEGRELAFCSVVQPRRLRVLISASMGDEIPDDGGIYGLYAQNFPLMDMGARLGTIATDCFIYKNNWQVCY
jgi:hypothetical protein